MHLYIGSMDNLPDEMIYEIYQNCGLFTRAKAAIHDPRIRRLFPYTPELDREKYEIIEDLVDIANNNKISTLTPRELITAANNMAPFKVELAASVRIYTEAIAKLIRGKTPNQVREIFSINQ